MMSVVIPRSIQVGENRLSSGIHGVRPPDRAIRSGKEGSPVATKEGDVQVIRDGGLTFKRYFTTEGRTRSTRSNGRRRDAVIPNFKEGGNAFEQRDVEFPVSWSQNATNIVAQKYFRGTLGTPQRESERPPARRPRRRHDPRVGREERLLRDRRRRAGLRRGAHPPARHPEGGVQLAGLVQRRRARHAAAVLGVLHPRRRRPHVARSSTGTSRRARSSRAAPARASTCRRIRSSKEPLAGGGTACGPGELHARRRRERRHDQVRRQDAPRGQDGDPQRRSPRRARLHLVQGRRGAQGAGAARRRVRHGPRRQGQRTRSSIRTRTTRCA